MEFLNNLDATTISVVAIVFLLVLSSFFSGSETALTAVSKPALHQLEQQGNKRAALVNRMTATRDRLLGAILLGNNLVNILASALATSVMITLFGDAGVVYATIAMTVIVLIFGEILPKTYAIHHSTRVALFVAPVVQVLVVVLAPIIHTIQILVRSTLHLFGARFADEASLTEALTELRGAIELHTTPEVQKERAMLRSILDLSDVEVGEIMTHRKDVAMIDASLPPDRIVDEVLTSPYTRIPLWKDEPDNVLGVLHAKALLRAVRARGTLDIEGLDIMALASPAWFIPDSTSLQDQLQAFRDRREHFALVVDEYGSLMGVVTLEDILEEIVGDISDEHDIAVPGVKPQANGSYVMDGRVTLRDLNREFDWNLPDEEASTIAGLVLHESRQIPKVGQTFLFHNFRFEVLRRHRNQITSIRLTPPPPKKGNGESEGR